MSQRKDDAAAARARAKAIVSDQKKKEKQKRILITISAAAVAIILLGLVSFFSFQSVQKTKTDASATAAQVTPVLADSNGAFYVSKDGKTNQPPADSKATRVDVFFDPQCPGCGVVDRGIGDRLSELVENGEIDLYLTPVSFLDKASSDRYSTRSVNAIVTVAEKSPENLLKFVHALYDKQVQPAEGGPSFSDTKLAALAFNVGVPENVTTSFKDHAYFDWIAKNSKAQMSRTDYFSEGFSTPSVFLNSKVQNGVASDFTKVKFADSDVLKTFNDTLSNLPKGK